MAAQPLFVSSGDLVADRRYQWALDYLQRGDAAAAADILAQVVETAPGFATAWFALASIREAMGDRDGAIAAFTAARDADREDYHGARLHLARLGVGEATPSMTGVYVRRLFDQHAPDFDAALVERLDYRGPELLLDAVRTMAGTPLRLGSVLDLGCGTGLGGAAFRPYCDWLVGVDISPGMIEQARAKGLYDRLAVVGPAGVPRRRAGRVASSGAGRRCLRLLQRHRADRGRRSPTCLRRAACSPSRSRRTTSRACGCKERCATPTAPIMCARRS